MNICEIHWAWERMSWFCTVKREFTIAIIYHRTHIYGIEILANEIAIFTNSLPRE